MCPGLRSGRAQPVQSSALRVGPFLKAEPVQGLLHMCLIAMTDSHVWWFMSSVKYEQSRDLLAMGPRV